MISIRRCSSASVFSGHRRSCSSMATRPGTGKSYPSRRLHAGRRSSPRTSPRRSTEERSGATRLSDNDPVSVRLLRLIRLVAAIIGICVLAGYYAEAVRVRTAGYDRRDPAISITALMTDVDLGGSRHVTNRTPDRRRRDHRATGTPCPTFILAGSARAGSAFALRSGHGRADADQFLGHVVRAVPARDADARERCGRNTGKGSSLTIVGIAVDRLAKPSAPYVEQDRCHVPDTRRPIGQPWRPPNQFGPDFAGLPYTVFAAAGGRRIRRHVYSGELDADVRSIESSAIVCRS